MVIKFACVVNSKIQVKYFKEKRNENLFRFKFFIQLKYGILLRQKNFSVFLQYKPKVQDVF